MVINESVLMQNGGEIVEYQSNESIFLQDTHAKHYLQVKSGTTKMVSYNLDGKEFLYGLPYDGHCIVESYLFSGKKYPFNASAVSRCEIIKLEKSKFIDLMEMTPKLLLDLFAYTSERIHYKNIMLGCLGIISSVERLTILLDYMKEFYMLGNDKPFIVPYTRQQLACLTGMTVETVIRTVKKMESDELLIIFKGKIMY